MILLVPFPKMTTAVYRHLWRMTEQSKARSNYGWYHVFRRLAPWGAPVVPAFFWWTFILWEDKQKAMLSLGFFRRELYYWDTRRSGGESGWYA